MGDSLDRLFGEMVHSGFGVFSASGGGRCSTRSSIFKKSGEPENCEVSVDGASWFWNAVSSAYDSGYAT